MHRKSSRTKSGKQVSRTIILGMMTGLLLAMLPGSFFAANANTPVTGAAFTTTNTGVDGTGHCKNGNEDINCNIYDSKDSVWLNGGPSVAYVGDGDYFFAVLDPGGQADPNDGASKNLSDGSPTSATGAGDDYTDRTFSVSGGTVTYGGPHDSDGNKIRLMGYDDTTNPGGVYILAVCSLADGYPVNASDCKYDAFKVQEGDTIPPAEPLTVSKDANGSYDNTYTWQIDKDVDQTEIKKVGGNATFNYSVSVSHDDGAFSNVKVTGTITVFNPNVVTVDGVNIVDELSDGTDCTVTSGTNASVDYGDNDFAYSCDLGDALPSGALSNTVTIDWPSQDLAASGPLAGGSADFSFADISFTRNDVDECVSVDDSYAGHLGGVCVGDDNPTTFTYSRTVAIPRYDCVSYDNTATFTTNDTSTTGSDSQTVTVCGPERTGALTMGFWQNKNGQAIINGGSSTANICNSATWLRQYAPFQNLSATATCRQTATYVTNAIKAANASGASMNAMLKGQMLATALDVYFSDPALGGNRIGAPAPIGGVSIDLTMVCKNIATCSIFENVSAAFGGASNLTVAQMLTFAASQSNVGGTVWYGQVKSKQELAKDAFDAINNQVAFGP